VFNPSITAVHPPRSAVGVSAVRLLRRRISEPTLPVHKIVLSPRLNVRDSTGALKAAASSSV
jgi:DNA-binding LacI/PurR family transcriptional regulator